MNSKSDHRQEMTVPAQPPTDGGLSPAFVVCWNSGDAGPLADRLRAPSVTQGAQFTEHRASLGAQPVVLIHLTTEPQELGEALRAALQAIKPPWVVLAASGRSANGKLKVGQIALANAFRWGLDHRELRPLLTDPEQFPRGVRWATVTDLVASDNEVDENELVDDPRAGEGAAERATQRDAQAADDGREAEPVIEVPEIARLVAACDAAQVAWSGVFAVRLAVGETRAKDVQAVEDQPTWARKFGAAAGALWQRPRVAVDWWNDQQRSLSAGDALATLLVQLLQR